MAKFDRKKEQVNLNAMRDSANRGESITDAKGNPVVEPAPAAKPAAEKKPTTRAPRTPKNANQRATEANKVNSILGTLNDFKASGGDFQASKPTRTGKKAEFEAAFGKPWAEENKAEDLGTTKSSGPVTVEVSKEDIDRRVSEKAQESNDGTSDPYSRRIERGIAGKIGADSLEGDLPEHRFGVGPYEGLSTLNRLANRLTGHINTSADIMQRTVPGEEYNAEYRTASDALTQLWHHLSEAERLSQAPTKQQGLQWHELTRSVPTPSEGKPAILSLAAGLNGSDVAKENDDFTPDTAEGHAQIAAKYIGTLGKWLEAKHKNERSNPIPTSAFGEGFAPKKGLIPSPVAGDPVRWAKPSLGKGFVNVTNDSIIGPTDKVQTYGDSARQAAGQFGLERRNPANAKMATSLAMLGFDAHKKPETNFSAQDAAEATKRKKQEADWEQERNELRIKGITPPTGSITVGGRVLSPKEHVAYLTRNSKPVTDALGVGIPLEEANTRAAASEHYTRNNPQPVYSPPAKASEEELQAYADAHFKRKQAWVNTFNRSDAKNNPAKYLAANNTSVEEVFAKPAATEVPLAKRQSSYDQAVSKVSTDVAEAQARSEAAKQGQIVKDKVAQLSMEHYMARNPEPENPVRFGVSAPTLQTHSKKAVNEYHAKIAAHNAWSTAFKQSDAYRRPYLYAAANGLRAEPTPEITGVQPTFESAPKPKVTGFAGTRTSTRLEAFHNAAQGGV